MSKRSLLVGFVCVVASCNLYDELRVATYDSLNPGNAPGDTDGPSQGVDAGVLSPAAEGGAPAAQPDPDEPEPDPGESDAGTPNEGPVAGNAAPIAGKGAAGASGAPAVPAAGSGGVAGVVGSPAAGSGGVAVGGVPDEPEAGSGGTGDEPDEPEAGSGGAGGAGGSTPDPSCPEPGGQVWQGNGHCYFPLLTAASWNVSRDQCAHEDATLATITSDEERDFVAGLISAPSWIGLARFGTSQFSWTTSEVSAYATWAAGEPNRGAESEAAVAMYDETGDWFDDAVNASHRAICERP